MRCSKIRILGQIPQEFLLELNTSLIVSRLQLAYSITYKDSVC